MKNQAFGSEWCKEFILWETACTIGNHKMMPTDFYVEGEIFVNKHATVMAWCDEFLQEVPEASVESISTVFREYIG